MFRFVRTLFYLDGPEKHRQREVNYSGSTLSTLRYPDGDWGVYGTREGQTYAVRLRQTGIFVAGKEGIMFGVTEVSAQRYSGVL